ncbi:hypothetical protein BC829DRAFT_421476 [Chytridium lagenaria]|nr:hypothetical protein BC829DRAFT_421476 [Chytridium lagenaria]
MTLRRTFETRYTIDFVLRAMQAIFSIIGLISLAASPYSFFWNFHSTTGFFYFCAVTTTMAAIALIVIPRNFADRIPSNYYLMVTAMDFAYFWFWLGSASTITNISNYCLLWNNLNYHPFTSAPA